jgi:hypothetical protein
VGRDLRECWLEQPGRTRVGCAWEMVWIGVVGIIGWDDLDESLSWFGDRMVQAASLRRSSNV